MNIGGNRDDFDDDHSGFGDHDGPGDEHFDDIEQAAADAEDEADLRGVESLAMAAAQGLQDEVDKLNDQLLRMAAELENTRRRAEKEKVDAGRYAIANFARDLLPVADNFERALAALPDDPSAVAADSLEGLVTGVKMTEKELLTALERHGVKRIDPTGEKFDPNLHQAVAQTPAPGVPQGHVAQTAQVGFVLADRVLRAAMVIVSNGEDLPGGGSSDSGSSGDGGDAPGGRIDTRV